MILARHTSADGELTLIAEQLESDLQIGFEGMPWHTHGDILAQVSGLPLQSAVERFLEELLHGRHVLALLRKDGALVDVWVTDDAAKDEMYKEAGEVLEFRLWDGTQVSCKPGNGR